MGGGCGECSSRWCVGGLGVSRRGSRCNWQGRRRNMVYVYECCEIEMLHQRCLNCCGIRFFFKQKTAYEMRISDWSSDVCSSDLAAPVAVPAPTPTPSAT